MVVGTVCGHLPKKAKQQHFYSAPSLNIPFKNLDVFLGYQKCLNFAILLHLKE